MSLLTKLAAFARSPQGRRFAQQAMRYAQSPQGRAKIENARRALASRGAGRSRPR
jgi:hypothetical protein